MSGSQLRETGRMIEGCRGSSPRSLSRRRALFVAVAAYAMMVIAALFAASGAVSTVAVIKVDDCTGPTERSRMLAEGISEAINCGMLVLTIEIVAALWLLFATWRWHWSLRPPVVKGSPPYR
jgi:hypothetical protein